MDLKHQDTSFIKSLVEKITNLLSNLTQEEESNPLRLLTTWQVPKRMYSQNQFFLSITAISQSK
jgi:hypothetical protein